MDILLSLDLNFLSNPVHMWLFVAGIATVIFITTIIIRTFALLKLREKALASSSNWQAVAYAVFDRLSLLFVLIISLYIGSFLLTLPEQTASSLSSIVSVIFVVQAALISDSLVKLFVRRQMEKTDDGSRDIRNAISLIQFLARTAVWSLACLMILDNLGIDVTALIAGIGIGGIAIALAAQRILSDLFASLAIILDKPFEVGDYIIFGEESGEVERIGIKTTRLRRLSGEELVCPNSEILASRIRNMKRMKERRTAFQLGLVYETSHEQLVRVPDILEEIVSGEEMARFSRAHFTTYGDFSLIFEIVFHVLSPNYVDYLNVQQSIYFKIFERFETEGLSFAYPTKTVIMSPPATIAPLEIS